MSKLDITISTAPVADVTAVDANSLNVLIQPSMPNVTTHEVARLQVSMGVFTSINGSLDAAELISNDEPNNLKTGTDGKLLATHNDIDFTAYYTLAKG